MTAFREMPEFGTYTVLNALQLNLIECPAEAGIRTIARTMAEHQTTHAVVIDPVTGRPIGILSTLDVARFLAG